ncbi:hypothetical protein ACJX0J_023704, partial [Zea mays]
LYAIILYITLSIFLFNGVNNKYFLQSMYIFVGTELYHTSFTILIWIVVLTNHKVFQLKIALGLGVDLIVVYKWH